MLALFPQHKSALIFLHHHHPNDWWPMPTLENSFTIHLISFFFVFFHSFEAAELSVGWIRLKWSGWKKKQQQKHKKRRRKKFHGLLLILCLAPLYCVTIHDSSSLWALITKAAVEWATSTLLQRVWTDREWVVKKKWSSADYRVNSRELHCQLVVAMCASLPRQHTEHFSGGRRRRERWKTAAREAKKKFYHKKSLSHKSVSIWSWNEMRKKYSHSRTAFFVLSVNSNSYT